MRNKKMIILLVSCLVILTMLILKNEKHLQQSKSIFIALEPVDPRSLLQGDYMLLRYNLQWSAEKNLENQIQNRRKFLAYVQLDENNQVIKTQLNDQIGFKPLWLTNPNNQLAQLYPAANSFLFAEGLAHCYADAQYAELKVNQRGEVMLFDLRGENLQPLNCKQQKKWWPSS